MKQLHKTQRTNLITVDKMTTQLSIFDGIGCCKWQEHHKANAHVYEAFKKEALKVIAEGFKHWSARTILHHLRHLTRTRENASDFKINNNWSSSYARLFEADYPQHKGFFELRRSNADRILKLKK